MRCWRPRAAADDVRQGHPGANVEEGQYREQEADLPQCDSCKYCSYTF